MKNSFDPDDLVTLYNYSGAGYQVPFHKLPTLLDQWQPATARMYVRCQLCLTKPNAGMHTTAGPCTY